VVMALANLGARQAIGPLVRSLADATSGVRRLAAAALSRIDQNWANSEECRATVEDLDLLLQERDSEARYFVEHLVSGVRAGVPAQAAAAASADSSASATGRRRKLAATLFLAVLCDQDRDLRQAAAEALGELGEGRAVSALIRALGDPDPSVRTTVEQSLRLLGAPGSGT